MAVKDGNTKLICIPGDTVYCDTITYTWFKNGVEEKHTQESRDAKNELTIRAQNGDVYKCKCKSRYCCLFYRPGTIKIDKVDFSK